MTPEVADEINNKIESLHQDVMAIRQFLLGFNGSSGLLSECQNRKKVNDSRWDDYQKFKTKMIILIAIAAGSGGTIGTIVSKVFGI